jgi:hypothetical protein
VLRLDNKPLERYWMHAPNQEIKNIYKSLTFISIKLFFKHHFWLIKHLEIKKRSHKENKNDV